MRLPTLSGQNYTEFLEGYSAFKKYFNDHKLASAKALLELDFDLK